MASSADSSACRLSQTMTPVFSLPRRSFTSTGSPPTWRTISRSPDGSDAITVRGTFTPLAESSCSTRILLRASPMAGAPFSTGSSRSWRWFTTASPYWLMEGAMRGTTTSVAGNGPPRWKIAGPSRPSRISTWSGSTTRATWPRDRAASTIRRVVKMLAERERTVMCIGAG
jgi:hypothetical protein